MTWLSRLLPQSPSLRLADHNLNRRNRQAERRRRMSTLESLEGRTLLSNITATQNGADVVTITGDTHNDQFSVTVNLNNTDYGRGHRYSDQNPGQQSRRRRGLDFLVPGLGAHHQPAGHRQQLRRSS